MRTGVLLLVLALGAMLPAAATAADHDTTLLSKPAGGSPGDAASSVPAISGNGRYVAFLSLADLLPADTDGESDVYRKDRETGDLVLVSTGAAIDHATTQGIATTPYVHGPSISDDGSRIAFAAQPSAAGAEVEVFLWQSGLAPVQLSAAVDDLHAGAPEISGDGSHVAWTLSASTSETFGAQIRDVAGATTTTLSANGILPTLSRDASRAALWSEDATETGVAGPAVVVRETASGNTVNAFALGTNDRDGGPPVISADGRYVAYGIIPSDGVVRVLRADVRGGPARLVSRATGHEGPPGNGDGVELERRLSISETGRYVAFTAVSTNLDAADTDPAADVYVRDVANGTTALVSRASGASGAKAGGESRGGTLSANGRVVAFESTATNLSADDEQAAQVFARELPFVALQPPVAEARPAITPSSNLRVGDVARCSEGTWLGDPSSFAYAWSSGGALIAGATGSEHTVAPSQRDKALTCTVTASNEGGGTPATSDPVVPRPRPPVNTARPAVTPSSGIAVGTKLTCATGAWTDADELIVQWRRNQLPIAGASATTYTLAEADRGTDLDCQVEARNTGGNAHAFSDVVKAPPPPAPPPAPAPRCGEGSSNPVVCAPQGAEAGRDLECSTPAFPFPPAVTYYTWTRLGVPNVELQVSRDPHYRILVDDLGSAVTCTVSVLGTDVINQRASRTSALFVIPAPAVPPGRPCAKLPISAICIPALPKDDNVTPVIFLPGILGSDLHCTDSIAGFDKEKELWPHLGLGAPDAFDLLTPRTSLFDLASGLFVQKPRALELRLDDDGVRPYDDDDQCNASVHPTRAATDKVQVAFGTVNLDALDIYGRTARFVESAGRGRGFVFGYDWRKSPAQALPDLDRYVDFVRAYTQSDKVTLFTHSMGGLVARWYTDTAPRRAKVARVVSVAPPYWGTPKGWFPLAAGTETVFSKRSALDLFIENDELQALAENMTGLYFLMPGRRWLRANGSWLELAGIDLEERGFRNAVRLYGGNVDRADEALKWMDTAIAGFPPDGPTFDVIAGSGMATIGRIEEIAPGLPEIVDVEWVNGDEAAPLDSVRQATTQNELSPRAQFHFLCGLTHTGQTGDPGLQAALRQFLFSSHQGAAGAAHLPRSGPLKALPCQMAAATIDILGERIDDGEMFDPNVRAARAARAAQAPPRPAGTLTVFEAEARGLVDVIDIGARRRIVTASTTQPVNLAITGRDLMIRTSRVAGERETPTGAFAAGSGTVQVSLPGGLRSTPVVRNGGRIVARRRPDARPPRTRAVVRRRGSTATVTLRARDASGVRSTSISVGGRKYRTVTGRVRVPVARLRTVRFFSVDRFGNAETPQRLRLPRRGRRR